MLVVCILTVGASNVTADSNAKTMSTRTPPDVLPILPARPLPRPAPPAQGWPFLRLGFRPFYLGAALFAALAVPLWAAVWLGAVAAPMPLPPLWWHAHEMLFGFAVAVIVGFLLTAGKAWTGLPTPRGAALGALAALWLSARVAGVFAPPALFALLDLLLLPVVAVVLTRLLLRAGNRRNLPLAGLLGALALANAAFHGAALGLVALPPLAPLHAGLALIVMIECVMAGRVVPSFTANATPSMTLVPQPRVARAALVCTALGLAGWVFAPAAWPTALALGAAALLQARLLWGWQPWVTRDRPILWVLHAAYAFVPIGLALLALAVPGWVAVSAGVHALAVGATGGLIIGMVTRTARGHTGRPLRVSRLEVAAYALVLAAALLRSLVQLVPQVVAPTPALVAAAAAWSAAFLLYAWRFGPWLVSTRADGQDG